MTDSPERKIQEAPQRGVLMISLYNNYDRYGERSSGKERKYVNKWEISAEMWEPQKRSERNAKNRSTGMAQLVK